jgi:hypothetical protein
VPDSTFPGDVEYVFKHNLERERLVSLTSPAAARRYHQAIADWLAGMKGLAGEEEYLSMLGEHLLAGGGQTRAGRAYLDAGDAARRHFRARKAEEHYQRGPSCSRRRSAPTHRRASGSGRRAARARPT